MSHMKQKMLMVVATLLVAGCTPHCGEKMVHESYPFGAEPYYLAPGQIKPTDITTPHKPGSKQWSKQLANVKRAMRTSTPAQKAAAIKEAPFGLRMVMMYLPDTFTRANYPQSFDLLDRAGEDCIVITEDAKRYWKTPRPYVADKSIKSPVKPIKNGGYPSGHTSCGWVWMSVAGELFPEKKPYLLMKAQEIGDHRLLVGMHMRQDVEGGHELGKLIMKHLNADADYVADLHRAQREVKNSRFNR